MEAQRLVEGGISDEEKDDTSDEEESRGCVVIESEGCRDVLSPG